VNNAVYRVTASTQFYAPNNDFLWPSSYGYYRFWLASVKSGVRQELGFYDYYLPTPPTDSLVGGTFTVQPLILNAETSVV
jgi:hypothetical protein